MAGDVDLEGGWRVYSSGPGLFLRLLTETLLGVRARADHVELDPVLDPGLDGLTVRIPLGDRRVRVTYRVREAGVGVCRVTASGVDVADHTAHQPLPGTGRQRRPLGPVGACDRRRDRAHRGDVLTGPAVKTSASQRKAS